jgi:hypothetical protein
MSKAIPLPIVDDCLFIDNSTLENFTACPRKYQFYAIEKREWNGPKTALNFGTNIHKAFEARNRLLKKGVSPLESFDEQVKALRESFKKHPTDMDDFRTLDRAIETMRKYEAEVIREDFEVLTFEDGTPIVEMPFAIPLGVVYVPPNKLTRLDGTVYEHDYIRVIWMGRIDAGIRRKSNILVWDCKTTSILGNQFYDEFHLSNPQIGYCWALQRILNERVHGSMIQAIANRKWTKTGKPIEFSRNVFYFTEGQIQEWLVNTLHVIDDLINCALRSYFPVHTKQCVHRYGKCFYHDVCILSTPEQRKFALMSDMFRPVTWSPLEEKTEAMVDMAVQSSAPLVMQGGIVKEI